MPAAIYAPSRGTATLEHRHPAPARARRDRLVLIDRVGRIYLTPRLAERIHFVDTPAEKIIIER